MYHKILGVLVRPFIPNYAKYVTTVGSIVYFPSRVYYETKPEQSLTTMAHEFVHVYDSQKSKVFKLAYLFPQILVMLPILGLILMAWSTTRPIAFSLLPGLLAIAPWPAPWRVEYELRGYGMTVAVMEWRKKTIPEGGLSVIVDQFVGPAYYYMSRNRAYIQRNLEATRQQATQGALSKIKPYSVVYDFFYSYGMIPRNDP